MVIHSGVRIRRNIEGFPFPGRSSRSQLCDSAVIALGSIGRGDAWNGCEFRMVDNLDNLSRYLLLEMRFITPLLAQGGAGRFFLRDNSGAVSCMINEEDHISISATSPGLEIASACDMASGLESALDIKPTRDEVLGYLTANPLYVGSGLTAYVMLHLPALDLTGETPRVYETFERDWKKLVLFRPFSDKGGACGSFFLLSNKKTLGVTSDDIIGNVEDAAQSLISKEMFARHKMAGMKDGDIGDKFWRAWGLLRHARKLHFSEAVDMFSVVKLGSDLGVLPFIDDAEWRRLVLGSQRYHLSLSFGRIIEQSEEPFVRAACFRQFIEGKSSRRQFGQIGLSDANKEL
jgi:protein arginine kinase